jgi:hypothetical protein
LRSDTIRPPHVVALASALSFALITFASSTAAAQTPAPTLPPLATGSVSEGALGTRGEASKYRYAASGPGVLTVAVHGVADLVLSVLDEDGQPLPEGKVDRDMRGEMGAEMVAVVLPRRGNYIVEVGANGGGGAIPFVISASFASMPAYERPDDPDGRPGNATAIAAGTGHEDRLHPDQGDSVDWYTLTATTAMTLFITTRVPADEDNDLILEAFIGGVFGEAAVRSDQDLQGVVGNETVSVDLKAGDVLHLKVSAHGERGGEMPYRIAVTRAP